MKCKDNYVLTSNRKEYLICYECQREELSQPIEDKEMKAFFDIPLALYKQSNFLRDIKVKYLRYGNLTEKQKEYFKKTVDKLLEES